MSFFFVSFFIGELLEIILVFFYFFLVVVDLIYICVRNISWRVKLEIFFKYIVRLDEEEKNFRK